MSSHKVSCCNKMCMGECSGLSASELATADVRGISSSKLAEYESLRTTLASRDAEMIHFQNAREKDHRILGRMAQDVVNLKAKCERYRGALKLIAQRHKHRYKSRHCEETYWVEVAHRVCAKTLANDSRIAQEALKEPEGDRG